MCFLKSQEFVWIVKWKYMEENHQAPGGISPTAQLPATLKCSIKQTLIQGAAAPTTCNFHHKLLICHCLPCKKPKRTKKKCSNKWTPYLFHHCPLCQNFIDCIEKYHVYDMQWRSIGEKTSHEIYQKSLQPRAFCLLTYGLELFTLGQ